MNIDFAIDHFLEDRRNTYLYSSKIRKTNESIEDTSHVAALAALRGGEGGIRTLEPLTGLTVFKTVAIDHSATSPARLGYDIFAFDARVSFYITDGMIFAHAISYSCMTTRAIERASASVAVVL